MQRALLAMRPDAQVLTPTNTQRIVRTKEQQFADFKTQCRNEIMLYDSMTRPVPGEDVDTLTWWCAQQQLPMLKITANCFLSHPVASVSCERHWAKVTLTCGARRGNLGSDTVRKLMLVLNCVRACVEE